MSYNLYNKETKTLTQIAGTSVGVAKFGSKQSGEIWGKTESSPWKAPMGGIYVRMFGDIGGINQRIIDKTDNINYTMYHNGDGSQQKTVLTIPIIQGHEYYDNSDNWGNHTDVFYPFIENVVQPIKGGIEYSTTETVIGTWIDGKPIYRKVFVLSTPINVADRWTVLKVKENEDLILRGRWFSNTTVYDKDNFSGEFTEISNDSRSGNIQAFNKSLLEPASVYMYILEYTKTTD